MNYKHLANFVVGLIIITLILNYRPTLEWNFGIFAAIMYFPLMKWGLPFLKN